METNPKKIGDWLVTVIDVAGKKIPVYMPSIRVDVRHSTKKELYTKFNFLHLKNGGNGTIKLDQILTLTPQETLQLGSMEMEHIFEKRWTLSHDTSENVPEGETPTFRLEIMEIFLPHPELTKSGV